MQNNQSETPLTDAAELDTSEFTDWGTGPSGYVTKDSMAELELSNTALKRQVEELTRERDEARERCDINAKQLLETVNDRNRIGVQLDLLRDELLRIVARIGESGLGDNPYLSNIADYCQRAQKDISVLYTPIEERDRACERLRVVTMQLEDCTAQLRAAEAREMGLREALKTVWIEDEMGWLTLKGQPDECVKCGSFTEHHEPGCLQGVIHKALSTQAPAGWLSPGEAHDIRTALYKEADTHSSAAKERDELVEALQAEQAWRDEPDEESAESLRIIANQLRKEALSRFGRMMEEGK